MKSQIFILFFIVSCSSLNQRNPSSEATLRPTWKLSFKDEFNGQEEAIKNGEDSSCYTRAPRCYISWGGVENCEEFSSQLKDLNKCTWQVYNYYNYMDGDAKEGEGINAFDASMVKVQDGYLKISAERSKYTTFNCKRKTGKFASTGEELLSKECPYISGGLDAAGRASGGKDGFRQKHGRWDIRMKFENAPGAWPALWLVPVDPQAAGPNAGCGWPFSGEIDIMEFWTKSPNKFFTTVHSGDCKSNTHISIGEQFKFNSQWLESFHIYSVEWNENAIVFLIDGKEIKTIMAGEYSNYYPMIFADTPLHLIMNLTIEKATEASKKMQPQLNNFPHEDMYIDWVKVYKACDSSDDPSECDVLPHELASDTYNSSANESATAELTAYPVPATNSDTIKAKFLLHQDCKEVRADVFDLSGNLLQNIFTGSLSKNEVEQWKIENYRLNQGMYILKAQFQKCGDNEAGKGDQVIKLIIY